MNCISVTLEVSNLFDKSILFNSLQLLNINDISFTFFVLNFIKFKLFTEKQLSNILDISTTFSVSKLETSIVVKF